MRYELRSFCDQGVVPPLPVPVPPPVPPAPGEPAPPGLSVGPAGAPVGPPGGVGEGVLGDVLGSLVDLPPVPPVPPPWLSQAVKANAMVTSPIKHAIFIVCVVKFPATVAQSLPWNRPRGTGTGSTGTPACRTSPAGPSRGITRTDSARVATTSRTSAR